MQTEQRLRTPPLSPRTVHPAVRAAAIEYGAAVTGSLAAARRHDALLQRLHAAESVHALVRLLFQLEGERAPGVAEYADALPRIEAAADWPAGYLRWALLDVLRNPAPRRQLELARRVNRLLASRGVKIDLGAGPDA